jgi:hypothetical protein
MSPRLLAALAATVALTGCAGYRLGPSNGMAAGEKSIQIRPFANGTLEPRLTDAVTAQLRREIQRDGTFRLATQDDGDIVVTGRISAFRRREIGLSTLDTLMPVDFQLTLTVHVTARDRGTGKVVLDKDVTGSAIIQVGTDLTDSERQVLPVLAGDVARNVTALLAYGSW